MRIAVAGTHGSGKTTLIADVLALCPGYEQVAEPYVEMAERGHAFSDPPTIDDMVDQLGESVDTILRLAGEPDLLFDRSPLDFIAYIEVLAARARAEWEPSGRMLSRIEAALRTLDLIVHVPLTEPDEITAVLERPRLRRAVDRRLKHILRDDELGLLAGGPRVVEISGSRTVRADRLRRTMAGA